MIMYVGMEMEKKPNYLEYIDNEVWKVIQNGNSKKRVTKGKDGVYRSFSWKMDDAKRFGQLSKDKIKLKTWTLGRDGYKFGKIAMDCHPDQEVLQEQAEGQKRGWKMMWHLIREKLNVSIVHNTGGHFVGSASLKVQRKEAGGRGRSRISSSETEKEALMILMKGKAEENYQSTILQSSNSDGELGTVFNANSTVINLVNSNDSDGEQGTISDHSVQDNPTNIPSIEQVTIATQTTQPQG
ncbi:hypothetical protein Tco_0651786 [Tanacetum coccineum]|uniref:Uncharacterized protein n=1 Tax=Tanacetum coccineum TaxID=301880 RepID=A0ABQ4WVT4_9ASTR